ncbi:hypothetical protein ACQR16_07485 [Bradyrhizobium oligotrophicum]|uniref:hypothetical protein n=1 Tax=Bradyrhizobium oligotrophicum TaxID=44255 RepID=UPI003EB81720
MVMQAAVKELLSLGPFPPSAVADIATLEKIEAALEKIQPPISEDDAKALVGLLGSDDCFGLAWTLVHLIETAPGWPIEDALEGRSGMWIEVMNTRSYR